MKILDAVLSNDFWVQDQFFWEIPEFQCLREVEQDAEYHPEGNVWNHTICVAKEMHDFTAKFEDEQKIIMRLAAWFHDTGKWISGHNKKTGRIGSDGHDRRSMEIARALLPEMQVPIRIIRPVSGLCREHMNHTHSHKAVVNMVKRLRDDDATMDQLILLKTADRFGRPPNKREIGVNLQKTIDNWEAVFTGKI